MRHRADITGRIFSTFCQKDKLLYFHIALETIDNPELSGYCSEGNVIDGGHDTAEKENIVGGSTSKSEKKKEKQSGVKHQQDVLAYMNEQNAGDLISSKVTMIKDLNISLSMLTTL